MPEVQEGGREIGAAKEGSVGPGVAACAAGLAGLALVLGAAGRFFGPEALAKSGWAGRAAAAVAAAVLATLVWSARRPLLRILSSLPFAVGLLSLILLATMLGTFILQGAAPEEYAKKYGEALAPLVLRLGLNDLFHSPWFAGWLALLALSLGVVMVRKRAWRPPLWGHGLAHLGVILVLAGGLVWSRWGMRGHIDLHEGETARAVVPGARNNSPARPLPLGFALRLEDFDIEYHPPQYRVTVYERSGESFRALRSFKPKEAARWRPAGASGAEFRVFREFPDLRLRAELKEAPPGEGVPALEIEPDAPGSRKIHLFAGLPDRGTVDLSPRGGPLLRFVWEPPPDAEVARWPETRPERHLLVAGPTEEIAVAPGAEVAVGGGAWRVRILAHYPDFVLDPETHQPATRSDRPNNPTLRVAISPAAGGPEEKRWLFAKIPDFGHEGDSPRAGPRLVYRHEPARSPAPREVLVVGKTGESWELENGRVLRKGPLPADGGLPGSRVRLLASARESFVPENRSAEWKNPAVEVEVRRGSGSGVHLLKAAHGEPLELPDGKTLLSLETQSDDVKAYRSRLAVLEGDRKVQEKTVEVNDPLSYGGFSFYQSGYRREDPTYSGILVVKDPGLPLVWAGLILIGAGMIFVYYVRPRLWKHAPDGGSP